MKELEKEKIYSQYMYSFPHKKMYENIDKNIIKNILLTVNGEISLYIHIPFCSSKCGYCNLFSVVTKENDYIDKYVLQILKEIDYIKNMISLENLKVTSLIIGGGTPLILSIENLEKIFNKVESVFSIDLKNVDFQIETSPNETSIEKLLYLKERGLKRISIGVQSFYQNELKNVFRQHSVEKAKKALDNINEIDFLVKNIDIIYGLPEQNEETLLKSLEKAVEYSFQEIFLYPLYVRENTILGKLKIKVDEEFQYYLYKKSVDFLEKNGYKQISMRRFSKKIETTGESCGFENSISFGCGGRSYLNNIHFCEEYSSNLNECKNIIDNYLEKEDFLQNITGFVLDESHMKIRFLIKNLGHIFGINKEEYYLLFKCHILEDFKEITYFIDRGLIIEDKYSLKLSKEGIGLSDYILYTFIPDNMKDGFNG